MVDDRGGDRVFRSRLRYGIPLRIDSSGVYGLWYLDENEAAHLCVPWEALVDVRRMRLQNPFVERSGSEARMLTGLFFRDRLGRVLFIRAWERQFEAAVRVLQSFSGPRWAILYDDKEIAAVHGGTDANAPSTFRWPFEIMPDPQLMDRGQRFREESEESLSRRRRKLWSEGAHLGAYAWLLGGSGIIALLAGELPGGLLKNILGFTLFVSGALIAGLGLQRLAASKALGPIEVMEGGILFPRVIGVSGEQFVPFSMITKVTPGENKKGEMVTMLNTLPWVAPLEVPAALLQAPEAARLVAEARNVSNPGLPRTAPI